MSLDQRVEQWIDRMTVEEALDLVRQTTESARWSEWMQRQAMRRAETLGASITQLADATGLSYDAVRMRQQRRRLRRSDDGQE